MEDRNVEFSNRYEIVPVEGFENIVDLIPAPGEVLTEGTPFRKQTMLQDATALSLGLDETAVPDDAFRIIANKAKIAKKTVAVHLSLQDDTPVPDVLMSCDVQEGEFWTDEDGVANVLLDVNTITANEAVITIREPLDLTLSETEIRIPLNDSYLVTVNVSAARKPFPLSVSSSGEFYLSGLIEYADIWGVGGGGGGMQLKATFATNPDNATICDVATASGGGGGRTRMTRNVMTKRKILSANIGAGGITGKATISYTDQLEVDVTPTNGGNTTVSVEGQSVLTALGGGPASIERYIYTMMSSYQQVAMKGGNGGSGGGAGASHFLNMPNNQGARGSDGSNGGNATTGDVTGSGGTGNGVSTKPFEDAGLGTCASGGPGNSATDMLSDGQWSYSFLRPAHLGAGGPSDYGYGDGGYVLYAGYNQMYFVDTPVNGTAGAVFIREAA